MTWIIGRAGPFGYSIGLSDIQVTLYDGTCVDCLQKVYKIGNQLVLGFAGSVLIGFENVNQITNALEREKKDAYWNPLYVSKMLSFGAKEIFKQFPKTEQNLGCELILMSVHPKENDGSAPWAKCFIYTYKAPEFIPISPLGIDIVSIGKGSSIEIYKESLSRLSADLDMFKLETGITGGSGLGLMMSITSLLEKSPTPGISKHIQICIVNRESVRIGANIVRDPNNLDDRVHMPRLATSMVELESILSEKGYNELKGSIC